MPSPHPLSLLLVWVLLGTGVASAQAVVDVSSALAPSWRRVNRTPTVAGDGERRILQLNAAPPGGLVWSPTLRLGNGTIEVDVRGQDVLQQSFLGIAFHITSDDEFEVVWLRPFNFQASDSARHAHAVQYASYPTASWQVLRERHPGEYEAAVPADIRPADWVHLRIDVRGGRVAVRLNGADTPVLEARAVGGRTDGGIGFWVGSQSPGEFSNLRIRSEP